MQYLNINLGPFLECNGAMLSVWEEVKEDRSRQDYTNEKTHEGANITKVEDALWWAVVTVATVGYGDYYPVTTVGRIIAVFMMLSGIGIFVLLVGSLSQRRLQRTESRLKRKTQAGLLGDEEKMAIKNKIDEIEKLTKEVHTLLGAY
jgi:Ion channel